MKKLSCFLFIFLLFPAFFITASATVECDGNVGLAEWKSCDGIILFEGHDVSDTIYRSMCVRYMYNKTEKRVCVSVIADSKNKSHRTPDEKIGGEFYVSFNDSSEISIGTDGTLICNEEEFFVRHGASADSLGGTSFEADIVLKELRLNGKLTMFVQLRDCNGVVSPKFEITISDGNEEITYEKIPGEKITDKKSEKGTKKPQKNEQKTDSEYETTEIETVIITEEYESFSRTLKSNSRVLVGIGIFCVLSSVAAMCFVIFRKPEKKE